MEKPYYYDMVFESYARCVVKRKFFDDFYDTFMSSSPTVAYKFRKTDMEKQKKLLDNGITMMIMFASGNVIGRHAMDHIAKVHKSLDITREEYGLSVRGLITTLRKYDPHFNGQVERGWREVMAVGIDYLTGRNKAVHLVKETHD